MDNWVKEKMELGMIEEGQAKVYSPHFVKWENNGEKGRVVGNFRVLNGATKSITDTTLPVNQVRAWCISHEYIGKIDLSSAFHRVPVATESRKFLEFVYRQIPYRYKVLPIGVKKWTCVLYVVLKESVPKTFRGRPTVVPKLSG